MMPTIDHSWLLKYFLIERLQLVSYFFHVHLEASAISIAQAGEKVLAQQLAGNPICVNQPTYSFIFCAQMLEALYLIKFRLQFCGHISFALVENLSNLTLQRHSIHQKVIFSQRAARWDCCCSMLWLFFRSLKLARACKQAEVAWNPCVCCVIEQASPWNIEKYLQKGQIWILNVTFNCTRRNLVKQEMGHELHKI